MPTTTAITPSVVTEAAAMAGVCRDELAHAVGADQITVQHTATGIMVSGLDGLCYDADTLEEALSQWAEIRIASL